MPVPCEIPAPPPGYSLQDSAFIVIHRKRCFSISANSQGFKLPPPPPRGSEYADLMSVPPKPPQTGTGDRVRRHSSPPIVNKQDVLPHNSVPDDGSFQSQSEGKRKGCRDSSDTRQRGAPRLKSIKDRKVCELVRV